MAFAVVGIFALRIGVVNEQSQSATFTGQEVISPYSLSVKAESKPTEWASHAERPLCFMLLLIYAFSSFFIGAARLENRRGSSSVVRRQTNRLSGWVDSL